MSSKRITANNIAAPAETHIGNFGELFYDPTSTVLRRSDGVAPGGIVMQSDLSGSNASSANVTATGGTTKSLANWLQGAPTSWGAAAGINIGTSGSTIPLLNGTNTWSGSQTFGSNQISGSNFAITGGTISGSNISGVNVTATGSTTARTLSDRSADFIYAKDYGVLFDGVADDTLKLQDAINMAQTSRKTLLLPPGKGFTTGVTITKPVKIVGHGAWGSILSLKTGSTAPAISISISTTDFLSLSGFANVILSDFQITSPNRTDAPGLTLAHGISLLQPASPQTTGVSLHNLLINGVPGDGIHSGPFTGFVEATDCEISYPGGRGLYANSAFDWIWTGGSIYGAITDNVVLSGATNFRFDRLNLFVAIGSDIKTFNSNPVFVNCMIDLTGTSCLLVNNPNGARIDLVGCTLRWASSAANATSSTLEMFGSNTGNVYLTNCNFPTPASSPNSNKPLNNINFNAGNTGKVYLSNTAFDLGPVATAGVTNDASKIAWQVPGETGSFTTLAVSSDTTLTSSSPALAFVDTSMSANLRRMVVQSNSQALQFYSTTDAGVLSVLGLTIARNGLVTAPVRLVTGAIQTSASLVNAADDAAAATAGVNLSQFYRNGSIVMQRVI